MLPLHRRLPTWFVVTAVLVLTATSLISAATEGVFALVFIAPIGCVCTSWAIFFAARDYSRLHLLFALVDSVIIGQWLWRRRDPTYDGGETWVVMIFFWYLVFIQIGVFLYTRREGS